MMEGEKQKGQRKAEKCVNITSEGTAVADEQGEYNGGWEQNPKLATVDDNVAVICADIKMMAMEMKSEQSNFRDNLKRE